MNNKEISVTVDAIKLLKRAVSIIGEIAKISVFHNDSKITGICLAGLTELENGIDEINLKLLQ